MTSTIGSAAGLLLGCDIRTKREARCTGIQTDELWRASKPCRMAIAKVERSLPA